MRLFLGVLVALTACGGAGKVSPPGSVAPPVAAGSMASEHSATSADSQPSQPVEPVATNWSCVFHAGAGRHHLCFQGTPGSCAHFGPPCTPDAVCTWNPNKNGHHTCSKFEVGECTSAGGTCWPTQCAYDPKSHQYKIPTEHANRWGERCIPVPLQNQP